MASPRIEPVAPAEAGRPGHGHQRASAANPEEQPRDAPGGDVRLLAGPFRETDATGDLRRTGRGSVGAVVTFTGVVRADDHDAAAVTTLGFETFPEMALGELERIRLGAVQRFRLDGLSIWHRTDTLGVGEPIVLVAAAARHRDDAFAAAAWTMDEVKRHVPLWKRETRADGTTGWVHADSCTCGQGTGPDSGPDGARPHSTSG